MNRSGFLTMAAAVASCNNAFEQSRKIIMIKTRISQLAVILSICFFQVVVHAQTCPGPAGCLDSTFGSDGRSLIPDPSSATIYHLLTQADGKLIGMTAGSGVNGHTVTRLSDSGSADSTFGTGGSVTFNWSLTTGNSIYYGNSNGIAIQNVGGSERLLIVGQAPMISGRKVLTGRLRIDRLMPDSSPDPSWGTNGVLQRNANSAYAVAVQADQKILIASATYDTLIRLNADGSVDTTFGVNGVVSSGNGRKILIDQSGHILVAGLFQTGRGNNVRTFIAVRRFSSSGVPDTNFGSNGQAIAFETAWTVFGLALDPFGNILAGSGFNGDFKVARLTANGVLDTSFSGDGLATVDFAGIDEGPAMIAVQSDGKVVLAGEADFATGPNSDFGVVRFNYDGSFDNTFGNGGKISFDMIGEDYLRSVVIQNDPGCSCEKIVAAGGGPGFSTFTRLHTF